RAAPRGRATLRLLRRIGVARAAGRADPRRAARGTARRQLVAGRRRQGHMGATGQLSEVAWARWASTAAFTIGVEEEVMLLDPRGQRAARPPARAARAVGQLAVLAGARQRLGLGPHTAVPGLPARGHPAGLRRLLRLRALRRPARAPGGVPRADLPVVGRPPAAALRD